MPGLAAAQADPIHRFIQQAVMQVLQRPRKTEEETCLAHSFVDDILDRQSLIVNGVAAIYSEADIRVLINTSVPVPMFLAPSAW
jgi:hypothetical protein